MPLLDEKTNRTDNSYKDKHFVFYASIVHIMKAHKVLNFKQLGSGFSLPQLGRIFNLHFKEIKK
jgi:hypothetical protein